MSRKIIGIREDCVAVFAVRPQAHLVKISFRHGIRTGVREAKVSVQVRDVAFYWILFVIFNVGIFCGVRDGSRRFAVG